MRHHTILAPTIVALLIGCAGDRAAASSVPFGDTLTKRTGVTRELSDTLLVSFEADSVVVRTDSGNRRVEWTRDGDGVRRVLFRSGDLHAGVPVGRLLDADGDGATDLFLKWWFEEQVSAVLLLGSGNPTATVVYSSPLGLCRPPELVDTDGDGRVEIVERWPGAASVDDCTGGGKLEDCVDAYALDWQTPLFANSSMTAFSSDSSRARGFFRRRAQLYQDALAKLSARESLKIGDPCVAVRPKLESLLRDATRLSEAAR